MGVPQIIEVISEIEYWNPCDLGILQKEAQIIEETLGCTELSY